MLKWASNRPTSGSTNGQPKGVASTDDGTVFVVTTNGAEVYAGGNVGKKVAELPLRTNPNCIAVHGKTVAIGAEVSLLPLCNPVHLSILLAWCLTYLQDHKLYLYTWDGTSLQEIANFDKNRSAVTTVAFSSDGKWLAAGESSGKIMLFTDEGSGFQVSASYILATVPFDTSLSPNLPCTNLASNPTPRASTPCDSTRPMSGSSLGHWIPTSTSGTSLILCRGNPSEFPTRVWVG